MPIPKTSFSVCLMLIAISLFSFSTLARPPQNASRLSFDAVEIRLGVDDMDQAARFYGEMLGFEAADGTPDADSVEMHNGPVVLKLHRVERPAKIGYLEAAYTYVNFQVNDLAESRSQLQEAGIELLHELPRKASIGNFFAFRDPSGNIHQILELQPKSQEVPKPTVFNVGIKVTDMKPARDFYSGKLGFDIFSEDYYPPVLPLKQQGGFSLVLHETATRNADTEGYPDVAATTVVLATDDLEAAMEELESVGVTFLHDSPQESGDGLFVALADPFGNILELREKKPMEAAK